MSRTVIDNNGDRDDHASDTESNPVPADSAIGSGQPVGTSLRADSQTRRSSPRGIGLAVGRVLALFVLFSMLSAPLIALLVHDHPGLSPVDELSYIDYLHKVDRGHLFVRTGDPLDGITLQERACRGIPPYVQGHVADCTKPPPPASGRNSADIDPPTYYWTTAAAASLVRKVGITHDFINSARLTGIFWAGAALTVVWLLCRRMGAGRWASFLACAAALATNGPLNNWYHVSPHAADMLVGGVVALAVVHWFNAGRGYWLLAAAGGFAALFKLSDILIAVVASLALLLTAFLPAAGGAGSETTERQAGSRPSSAERRRHLLAAGAVLGGLLVTSLIWLAVRRAEGFATESAYPRFNANHFNVAWLFQSLGLFVAPLEASGPYLLVAFFLYGTLASVVFNRQVTSRYRNLATATAMGGLFGPCLLLVAIYVVTKQHVPQVVRYGLSLYPSVLAFGALNLRDRRFLVAATIIVGVCLELHFHPLY